MAKDGNQRVQQPVKASALLRKLKEGFVMTKKRKKTTDQNTAGKPTPKESLWSKRRMIPSGDPRLQGGFVIGERRLRPLSKKGTQKKS